jgi:dephospho-CoA kinase
MLKIGLTGGIGSGKTTVAKVFEILGIPVYYADDAARNLMNTNARLKDNIIAAFGPDSYENEMINRPYVSSLVFNNPEKLVLLNHLVHPVTIADAENWMKHQTTPYAIKEAALIFESGAQEHLDHVIGVSAPLSLRILRTMKRDKISREAVLQKMDRQMDESIKLKLCDFVIVNDELTLLIPQVLALHEKFLLLGE